jgi:hypothetical protein
MAESQLEAQKQDRAPERADGLNSTLLQQALNLKNNVNLYQLHRLQLMYDFVKNNRSNALRLSNSVESQKV